jgi:hypothetical protein
MLVGKEGKYLEDVKSNTKDTFHEVPWYSSRHSWRHPGSPPSSTNECRT